MFDKLDNRNPVYQNECTLCFNALVWGRASAFSGHIFLNVTMGTCVYNVNKEAALFISGFQSISRNNYNSQSLEKKEFYSALF